MSLKSTKTPDDSTLSPDVTKLSGFTGSTTTFLRGDGSFATPTTGGTTGITQLTGDVLAGPGSGSVVATLATTGVTTGTYGSSTEVPIVSVNAKGLVTTISTVAISTSGGSGITELTGDVLAGPGSGSQAATLATTGVAAGNYGSSTIVPVIDVDAKGRITTISTAAISGSGSIGNLLDYKAVAKTTNTGRVNSTVSNDPELFFAVGANQTWLVDFTLFLIGVTNADFQYQLSVPAGATGILTGLRLNAAASTILDSVGFSATTNFTSSRLSGVVATTAPIMMLGKATVVTLATTGTVALAWAQGTTQVTGSTIMATSYIEARRIV